VWQARLQEAEQQAEALPKLKWGIAIVVGVWVLVLVLLGLGGAWLLQGA
jgi:hypothetical protein